MIYVVDFARFLSIGMWAVAFFLSGRSALRGFGGSEYYHDIDCMVFWAISLLCIGFGFRWVFFPTREEFMPALELGYWAGLYVLSSAVGGAVAILSKPPKKNKP